jgi:transcriptional regulator with XRE-family HTH domain
VEDDSQPADLAEQRFATNLRAARDRAGLSQRVLAAQMRQMGFRHMHQQTIAQIEAGTRSVRLGEADALASILRTNMTALMRPAGLAMREAELIAAIRALRAAITDATRQGNAFVSALGGLERCVARAEADEITADLADVMSGASAALKAARETAGELAASWAERAGGER